MRSALQTSPRRSRRALALLAGLLLAAGGLSACSDEGPPTPAISGENPAEVTIPTTPPTTTTAAPGGGGDTTTTVADSGATPTTGG